MADEFVNLVEKHCSKQAAVFLECYNRTGSLQACEAEARVLRECSDAFVGDLRQKCGYQMARLQSCIQKHPGKEEENCARLSDELWNCIDKVRSS